MNRKHDILISAAAGTMMALLTVLALTAILSKYIITGSLKDGSTEIILSIILFLAAFIGNTITLKKCRNQFLILSLINELLMLAVLLITSMCIDGPFHNFLLRVSTLTGGIVVSYIICQKNAGKRRTGKRRSR